MLLITDGKGALKVLNLDKKIPSRTFKDAQKPYIYRMLLVSSFLTAHQDIKGHSVPQTF